MKSYIYIKIDSVELISLLQVDLVVRHSSRKFYFKPKESAEALKINKTELKVIIKIDGELSKPFRVPITDGKTTRCYRVQETERLRQAFYGKITLNIMVHDN